MKILELSAHFSPNVGGVETHLDDLVSELTKLENEVFVLTYRPLTTKVKWKVWETKKYLSILRIPWLPGLFYKLINNPLLQFLYLIPGLFFIFPLVAIFFRPHVIHAHGLASGFIGAFWGKLFKVKMVISVHSIYNFPKSGVYSKFCRLVFNSSNSVLCLSNQSVKEFISLGIPESKVHRFTYWVDQDKFKPLSKNASKINLGWKNNFVVLFVGRLVAEKGVPELVLAAKSFKPGIKLKIAGSGPLLEYAKQYSLGRIDQKLLPTYYSASDLLIVPSMHEEGYGRVIIEALSCGLPVIAANRGAIPEAMSPKVGKLISVSPENIAASVNYYFDNNVELSALQSNCRNYAEENFSSKNFKAIYNSLASK